MKARPSSRGEAEGLRRANAGRFQLACRGGLLCSSSAPVSP